MTASKTVKILFVVLLACGLWLARTPDARATNITVNTTSDSIAPDGQCSLREAITAANTDTSSGGFGECPAGGGSDIITVPAGTYFLQSFNGPLPDITTSLSIYGESAATTIIDAQSAGSVFVVSSFGDLSVVGLTLTGGNSFFGGGIENHNSTVSVTDSTISGNNGSGIANSGQSSGLVAIKNSRITGNAGQAGGGIYNGGGGSLTVTNSTIDANTATGGGGGIRNSGTLVVADSTVTGNTAVGAAHGGGIHNSNFGVASVINSTISGNTALTGGGILNVDDLTVVFSTITDNTSSGGAGIDSGSPFGPTVTRVSASIVADNQGLDLGATSASDTFVSGSFNVIGSTSPGIVAFGGGTDDLVGQALLGLAALDFNASGTTETHAITDAANPAYDHVTGVITIGTDQIVDQNGSARPQSVAKDAGAYEAPPLCPLSPHAVSTEAELNYAIGCYNAMTSGALVVDVSATITYTSTIAPIDNASAATLTINGGANTFDAAGNGRVLTIGDGDVTIDNLTLTGGDINSEAGGIFNFGALTVMNSTISGNAAAFGGGGIFNAGFGTLKVTNSTINDNTSYEDGGGIYNSGLLTVSGSTISGNMAGGRGGGIHQFGEFGAALVTNSTISGNSAVFSGGGIHTENVPVTVVFSTVTDNTAPAGSGISSRSNGVSSTQVSASIVADNIGAGNDLDLTSGSTDSFGSGSFNVIGSTDANIVAFGAGTGDLVGQSNLGLLALALNGATTETHALADGSMAVDRVSGAITIGVDQVIDQRGTVRPQGSAKDAGAFEAVGVLAALCDNQLVTINLGTNGGLGAGTGLDDVILGTALADTIHGRAGNDTICAGDGGDTVRGGSGDDTIFGGSGADLIRGGGGADTIDGGGDDDTILGQGGPDTIEGGPGADDIDGQGAADTISGGAGDDTIDGQNGGDLLFGNSGNDSVKGQTGPDEIRGEGGDDDLGGGNGADTLYGGPGTDKCAGNTGPDSAQAATCESTPGVETLF